MANRISWVAVGNLVAQDAAWFYAFPSKPKADEFVRLAELHTKDVEWCIYPCDHDTPEQAAQYFELSFKE